MEILMFVLIGLFAGVVSGLFGVGGGLVIVPSLLFLAKFKIHAALGTSLGALLLPVGLLGVLHYYKGGNVNIKVALIIGCGIFIGTYIGAKIVQPIPVVVLRRIYAIFLIIIAGKLLIGK
ncbi:permease [bacterium F11]|nr:permease [bacterium F11]